MAFSLLNEREKRQAHFHKVTWVYKEKVKARWWSRMAWRLDRCQSPKKPALTKGNYSRWNGLKQLFLVEITTLKDLPTLSIAVHFPPPKKNSNKQCKSKSPSNEPYSDQKGGYADTMPPTTTKEANPTVHSIKPPPYPKRKARPLLFFAHGVASLYHR